METFVKYLLISTACISVFYIGYLLLVAKTQQFKHQRYFLLVAMFLSLIMPLSQFQIHFNLKQDEAAYSEIQSHAENSNIEQAKSIDLPETNVANKNTFKLIQFLIVLYVLGLVVIFTRLLMHLAKICSYYKHSEKKYIGNIPVLLMSKTQTSFSFFKWIFLPENFICDQENREIVIHEHVHASQYHSIDIILMELLTAVMWFNPLVWMMRNSIRLVHEYLADEGVINTGIDKIRYQALLINQVAEEKLICLSSNFNHSLIKKRLIMITKTRFIRGSKLRVFTLIPIVGMLFIGVACIKGKTEVQTNTTKTDVENNTAKFEVQTITTKPEEQTVTRKYVRDNGI